MYLLGFNGNNIYYKFVSYKVDGMMKVDNGSSYNRFARDRETNC